MSDHKIEPSKVTKPIQLLAAWLVGLVLIDGVFLAAAVKLDHSDWQFSALIVSAIVNVPLFLIAILKVRATTIGLAAILAWSAGVAEPKYAGFDVTNHDDPKVSFTFSPGDATSTSPIVITIPGRKLTNADRATGHEY